MWPLPEVPRPEVQRVEKQVVICTATVQYCTFTVYNVPFAFHLLWPQIIEIIEIVSFDFYILLLDLSNKTYFFETMPVYRYMSLHVFMPWHVFFSPLCKPFSKRYLVVKFSRNTKETQTSTNHTLTAGGGAYDPVPRAPRGSALRGNTWRAHGGANEDAVPNGLNIAEFL